MPDGLRLGTGPVASPSAGPFRVRVEDLRLKPNIPAGMDPYVLLGLVPLLRRTAHDHDPIVVRALPCGAWQVMDGRHRWFAAVIAGRPDVLAVEELPAAQSMNEPSPRLA